MVTNPEVMATLFSNITSLGKSPFGGLADSQSVDPELESGLQVFLTERTFMPVQELTPLSSTRSQPDLRNGMSIDVSADPRGHVNPTAVGMAKRVRIAPPLDPVFKELLSGNFLLTETITANVDRSVPEGSTASEELSFFLRGELLKSKLLKHLVEVANDASEEVFIDGVESVLSRELAKLVQTHGDVAVSAIALLVADYCDNSEIIGEIIRQLGYMDDPQTHRVRLRTIITHLESSDPRIRDAASLGLAALDDPAAVDAVCRALDRESSQQLRRNLGLVLDQLKSTKWHDS